MKKQLLAAILALSALAAISCGDADSGTTNPDNTTEIQQDSSIQTDSADAYPYEKADLGGYQLRILNIQDIWNMFVKIDT